MCDDCRNATINRRSLLGGALVAGLVASGTFSRATALAAEQAAPTVSADPGAVLGRLLDGNRRYLGAEARRFDGAAIRKRLVMGQAPYACVLGCSDSRASIELLFDQQQGDVFVVRNAGGVVDRQVLGSLEYAVAELHTPLLFVVGHSGCGAVSAAVAAARTGKRYPGHITDVVRAIEPAARRALRRGAGLNDPELMDLAVAENVRQSLREALGRSAILARAYRAGRLGYAGGVYELATGQVKLVQ